MKLEGKVAIITGSSRGIGHGIAEGFIKEGARVAICGSTLESANKGAEDLKNSYPNADIFAVELNVAETASVAAGMKAVVDHFGSLDVLVNNAGIAIGGTIAEISEETFLKIQNVNVTGTFRCIKEATKYMATNGGSIINVASINGVYGSPRNSAYATSKSAVIGLTKSLGRELGGLKIRVNAITPGLIETDMVSVLPEETKARLIAMTPVGRSGETSDLAGICTLLASDESSFITAAIFAVDGGAVL